MSIQFYKSMFVLMKLAEVIVSCINIFQTNDNFVLTMAANGMLISH